jgi:hypothetical protein
VRVDFTLTVCNDYDSYYDVDPWNIRVLWDVKAVRLLGDSVFPWSGPHPRGAELTGSFEVIPLLSGLHGFSLYWDEPGLYDSKLDVRWCFDKDGFLTFLGKVEPRIARPPSCTPDWCTFFNGDSVTIGNLSAAPPVPGEAFAVSYTISPILRIGDTSEVRYYLQPHSDFLSEWEVQLVVEGMELVSPLPSLTAAMEKGEIMVYDFRVVPLAVREVHEMTLNFENKQPATGAVSYNIISCYSVFNNNGSLRFITHRPFTDFDSTLLPTAFRPLEKGDSEIIRVEPGKNKVFRHKY